MVESRVWDCRRWEIQSPSGTMLGLGAAVVLFRRADLGGVEKIEEEVRGGMDFGAWGWSMVLDVRWAERLLRDIVWRGSEVGCGKFILGGSLRVGTRFSEV